MNHFEVYFISPNEKIKSDHGIEEVNIRLSYDRFLYLMKKLSLNRVKYKFFKKSFKLYCTKNLCLEHFPKDEPKVYEKNTKYIETNFDKNFVIIGSDKHKKPYHSFPSTTKIHNINYINRLTFRVTNRIYLNFDAIRVFNTDELFYKVFLNFNSDSNTDMENAQEIINSLITMFT